HRILVVRVEGSIQIGGVDVLQVGQLRLVDRLQLSALDQRLDYVGRRNQDVVSPRAGRELGQQLLVVGVIGLDHFAFAEVFEALDRLGRNVIVPVVEMELVLRACGGQQ